MNQTNSQWMAKALELAARSQPTPNPAVGCVIIRKGKIVGQGWHKKAGQAHAEINALRKAGQKARNAEMFVSLEPCCHSGRTGPCTQAIIKAGVKKVFVAMKDPNPKVKGQGLKELRKAGLEVELLQGFRAQAEKLNEAYIKWIAAGKPFVALKAALSLDGKIACNSGESQWISSKKSRHYGHQLRARHDAVLVGINTLLQDNPRLDCRLSRVRNPIKIVVDSQLRVPLQARVLKGKVIIAATKKACQEKEMKVKKLREKGAIILTTKGKRVDLTDLMRQLAAREITSILVEGGGTINAAFLKEKLADKIYFFMAPKIIGGRNALTAVEGQGINSINESIKVKNASVQRLDQDILVEGYIEKN